MAKSGINEPTISPPPRTPEGVVDWLQTLVRDLTLAFRNHQHTFPATLRGELRANQYTTATLPSAPNAGVGAIAIVTDAGTPPQMSDGVNWLTMGAGGGGGDNIRVFTGGPTAASDADFHDTNPAAPAGSTNVKWQIDTTTAPDQISAYVDRSAFGAVPAVLFGTAYAAGAATTFVRTDATLKFPTSLMSAANSATLVLTDNGTDETLTGSLGNLTMTIPGAFSFQTTGNPSAVANIIGTPGSGQVTLLSPAWGSGAVTSTSIRCWDAKPQTGGTLTTATLIGYDTSNFTITPGGGSDTANKGYCGRLVGPIIANNTGGWTELAALYLGAPQRSTINAVVSTLSATMIAECATVGTTEHIGIYIKQRAAQQTATNRYGLKIDTHNSGTNRWGIFTADRAEVQSQSAQAQTALLLRQLSTGATAGAHVNFDDKAGNPGSPNTGDLWRNGAALNYRKDGSTTVDLAAAASGDAVRINSTDATNADFEDLLPAPPTALSSFTGLNVKWQIDTAATPDDISAYVGKDINGNWMVSFSPTASAVNYVGFVNSATGISPRIIAQGTDADVNLRLSGFGTAGKVVVDTGSPAGGSQVVAKNVWANHFVMMGA